MVRVDYLAAIKKGPPKPSKPPPRIDWVGPRAEAALAFIEENEVVLISTTLLGNPQPKEDEELIDGDPHYWQMLRLHRTHGPANTNSFTSPDVDVDRTRSRQERTMSPISPERDDQPHLDFSSEDQESVGRGPNKAAKRPSTSNLFSKKRTKKTKIPLGATSPVSSASSSMEEVESSDVSSSSLSSSPAPSTAGRVRNSQRQNLIDLDAIDMERHHENEKLRLENARIALEERTKRARAKEERKIRVAELAHEVAAGKQKIRVAQLVNEKAAREERKEVYPLYLEAVKVGVAEALKKFQYWYRD
ncbi:uncharacterized protein JCM15063_006355 [Sporobolomyces koalae]|uniref:uncharacterized protein n=1 Tax=Sporobolomyces koalae TaxID=500713 RepID=UPI003181E843